MLFYSNFYGINAIGDIDNFCICIIIINEVNLIYIFQYLYNHLHKTRKNRGNKLTSHTKNPTTKVERL